jgi:hypothetical protein
MSELIQDIKPDDVVDFRFLPKDLPVKKKVSKEGQRSPNESQNIKKKRGIGKQSDSSQGNLSIQGGLKRPQIITKGSIKGNILG